MPSRSGVQISRVLIAVLATLLGLALTERASEHFRQRFTAKAVLQIRKRDSEESRRSIESIRNDVTSQQALQYTLHLLRQHVSDAAQLQLQRKISLREIRNTELVEIRITDSSPQVAADSANAVAETLIQIEIVALREEYFGRRNRLRAKVEEQQQKVAKLREECDAIRMEENIFDLYPEELQEEDKPLSDAITELKVQIAAERALNEKINALSDAQILEEISKNTAFGKSLDPTLSSLSAELGNIVLAEEKLTASNLEDPKLVILRSQKLSLQKQLSGLVLVLRERHKTLLASREAKLGTAQNLILKKQPQPKEMQKYRNAKRLYIQERKALEAAEMKMAVESLERSMPGLPVTLWEKAEPPTQPDPWPTFIRILGPLLGLLVGIGLTTLPRPGITAGVLLALIVIATFQWWPAALQSVVNYLHEAGFV